MDVQNEGGRPDWVESEWEGEVPDFPVVEYTPTWFLVVCFLLLLVVIGGFVLLVVNPVVPQP